MEKDLFLLFKEIYCELFKHNVYNISGDKYYHDIYQQLHKNQDIIIQNLRKVLNEKEVHNLIEEHWDYINNALLYYEYRDFKYFLAGGIAIGIAITKDLDDKSLQTIIQKVMDNFN